MADSELLFLKLLHVAQVSVHQGSANMNLQMPRKDDAA